MDILLSVFGRLRSATRDKSNEFYKRRICNLDINDNFMANPDPKEISTGYNSTFAIGGVSFSADSLVVAENFVLRINISGKNPAHRKSAKR